MSTRLRLVLSSATFLLAVLAVGPKQAEASSYCNEEGYDLVFEQCLADGNLYQHCLLNTQIFICNCDGGDWVGGPAGACVIPE